MTELNNAVFGNLSPVEEALCTFCADEGAIHEARLLSGDLDQELWSTARRNGVASIVAHRLNEAGIVSDDADHWEGAHADQCARIAGYMAELDRIAALMSAMEIPLAALKNAGIARAIYPCVGCCPMGDLDLLIQKCHFQKAHRALIEDGYIYQLRDPLKAQRAEDEGNGDGAEYWKQLPGGGKLWLELQWKAVGGRWIRTDQEPTTDELLDRSMAVEGTSIRLLAPEDNLLQVALHTAKHSYVRAPGFRLHTDVDRIVRRQPVDWSSFLSQVTTLEVRTAVYFSLSIPRALFSTPIPAWVLAELEPSAWRRWALIRFLRAAGLFDPSERKFGRLGYIIFNALLYDDLKGLWRAMFPAPETLGNRREMQSAYRFPHHIRRLADLAFRRVAP